VLFNPLKHTGNYIYITCFNTYKPHTLLRANLGVFFIYFSEYTVITTLTALTNWSSKTELWCINCKKELPSSEANNCSADQEIPHALWNLMLQYHNNSPLLVSILSQINPAPTHTLFLLDQCFILSSHLVQDLPNGLLASYFPIKTLYIPLTLQCILNALYISFFFVNLVKRTFYKAPNYVIFFSLHHLLLLPMSPQHPVLKHSMFFP